jgi:GT2 family glycosyltransferase
MTTTPIGEGKGSVVIPCFNQGAMLREALASVEQVRNANLLEVIVVDDGSSKADTTRILGEVAQPGRSGDRGYNVDFELCQDLDLFLRLSEVGLVENLPDILLSWR